MTSCRITRTEWADLVAAYRAGVPGASDRLWCASLRLVPRILAAKFGRDVTLRQALAGMERADLDQQVAVEILEAARRYDPQRSSWTTYLSHRLYGRLRDLARRQLRWDGQAAATMSLDEAIDEDQGTSWHEHVAAPGPSPEDVASRMEALSHYLRSETPRSKRA